MNHVTQLNRLQKQLQSYKDFMPICCTDDIPQLMREIQRICNRIKTISNMNFDEAVKEVVIQYETKQSKVNFLKPD